MQRNTKTARSKHHEGAATEVEKSTSTSDKANGREAAKGGGRPISVTTALSLIAGFLAVLYYIGVVGEFSLPSSPRQHFSKPKQSLSADGAPIVDVASWELLFAPHAPASLEAAGGVSGSSSSDGRAVSAVLRTIKLPHLASMLAYRMQRTPPSQSTEGEEKEEEEEESTSTAASAAALASRVSTFGIDFASASLSAGRLSRLVDEISPLLKYYEDSGMEDVDAITAHYWPSLSVGKGASARPKALPHDVMLLGEWVSVLSSALRMQLFAAGSEGSSGAKKQANKEEDNTDAKGIQSSSAKSPPYLPLLSREQQLLTLCAAEVDILPRYMLLVEDSTRHLESLFDAVECLRALRDGSVGTVAPASAYLKQLRAATGDTEDGMPRSGLFGGVGERAPLNNIGETVESTEGSSFKHNQPHSMLAGELGKLVVDRLATTEAVRSMLSVYARGSLCADAVTDASNETENTYRFRQATCADRFTSLAYPSGLDTRIGTLLEEAIAMESQFAPLRVMYFSHIAFAMGRCGAATVEAVGRELQTPRVHAAPTAVYRTWFQAIRDVCQRVGQEGEDGEGGRGRNGGTLGSILRGSGDAGGEDDGDVASHFRSSEAAAKKRFPLANPPEVEAAFKAIRVSPRLLLGEKEYSRFIRLITAIGG